MRGNVYIQCHFVKRHKTYVIYVIIYILKILEGYTLNAVNKYGENLLHISAVNDCFRIVKEILSQKKNCRVIDRKNKFGWSPLMQAIRNGNIDTVKMLLEKNANIDDATYLGK